MSESTGLTTGGELVAPVPAGARSRIEANLEALRVAQALGDSGAEPTPEQRAALKGWTSWGAVHQIFDRDNEQYATHREQLAELLSVDEYRAARRTVLNAHYTDDDIVRAMWSGLSDLGFSGGQVLEPGCGSGQFMEALERSALATQVKMTGVELDPMTAQIAQLLHPQARVRAESFADSPFHNDTFDAVIGNVPFGQNALYDPTHNPNKHSIHNHFIVKSLDLTRPGGLVAVLTSRYTLDAGDPSARLDMYERADLVGAVRLPTGAHRRLAGTEAVTDLLIFKRRAEGAARGDDTWVHTSVLDLPDRDGDLVPTRLNSYFESNPDMVLGRLSLDHGMHSRHTLTVRHEEATHIGDALRDAVRTITSTAHTNGMVWEPASAGQEVHDADAVVETVARTGDISSFEGHLAYDTATSTFTKLVGSVREEVQVPVSQQRALRELIALRDTTVALLDAEGATLEDTPEIGALRSELNRRYDAYTARFGPINRVTVTETARLDKYGDPIVSRRYSGASKSFRTDPHSSVVRALESYDEKTQSATKMPIMHQRVIAARVVPTRVEEPGDALAIAWDETRTVDLDRIAGLLGTDVERAREALAGLVFDDPDGGLVPRAEYLSGDVRAKLVIAEAALEERPELIENVTALREVMPRDLLPEEITVRMGAVWVSREDHEQFLREILDDPRVTVAYGGGSAWKITQGSHVSQKAVSEWGTQRMDALELAGRLMTQKRIVVNDIEKVGDSQREVLNAPETEAARAKAEAMQEAFEAWVWADPQRSERLAKHYNELFNSYVLRDYAPDGERLTFPGLVATFNPHPHQRTAVARMISEPSVGLYHGVGAGKTAEMVMGAMELGRLGLVSKPAVVVPNHMLEQVTTEWLGLYPNANVLAAGSEDLRGDGRREFIAKAATGAWDGIVLTQGAFGSLDVSRATRKTYRDRVVGDYVEQLERLKTTGDRNYTTKRMERAIQSLEERLNKQLDMKKDPGLTFEQTGIDYLLVDELHMFKNRTVVSNIPDAASAGSLRATDLDMKITYLRDRALESGRNPRVMTGATATPIANSMAEAYVMQTYLRPDLLQRAGITDFDSWAATFGETVTELEMAPEGGFKPKTRFARFNNLPELLRMWHVSADVKTSADLQLKVPLIQERADGRRAPELVVVEPTQGLLAFMDDIGERADRIKARAVEPTEDNMLKLSSHGRWAGLDLRLLPEDVRPPQDPALFEPTKVDVAAAKIHGIWEATKDREYLNSDGTPQSRPGAFQIVFCDLGTPKGDDEWDVYNALRDRLGELGMDRSRIAFVHDANTDAKKDRLFAECRTGGVDVLIGSTGKMGVGTNVQTRAVALHHLDCPWRPADLEQRDGRIIRQGNQNPEVQILQYVTERSFDTFMWQTVERKAKFIEQVMNGDLETRSAEDIETSASFNMNEVKAISSGNPLLLEKAQADQDLARLENLHIAHGRSQAQTRAALSRANDDIASLEARIPRLRTAITQRTETSGENFSLTTKGHVYDSRTDAAATLREQLHVAAAQARARTGDEVRVQGFAELGGHVFDLSVTSSLGRTVATISLRAAPQDVFIREDAMTLAGMSSDTGFGIVTRLHNKLSDLEASLESAESRLALVQRDKVSAEMNLGKEFAKMPELLQARRRVAELQQEMAGDKPLPIAHQAVQETEQESPSASGRAQFRETMDRLRHEREARERRGVGDTDRGYSGPGQTAPQM